MAIETFGFLDIIAMIKLNPAIDLQIQIVQMAVLANI